MSAVGVGAPGPVILSAAKDRSAQAAKAQVVVSRSSDPSVAALPQDDRGDDHPKLRAAARQLTGVFAQQLFKAMRETVPQGEGAVTGGSGEEMFTGMLDEHLAGAGPHAATGNGDAGAAFTRGLADAVYRRLRAHAGAASPEPAPEPASGAPPTLAVTPTPGPASLVQPPPAALR